MHTKTAIITGISGQDGSYLAKLLLEKQYEVVGVTRANTNRHLMHFSYLGISKQCQIEVVDLTQLKEVELLIKKHRPSEIYHLAAMSSVGASFQNPHETILFNSLANLNLIETIRNISPQTRYFHAASSEIYGDIANDQLPITEKTILQPVSPYAVSKAAAYWTTTNYRTAYNLFASNGILFNHESVLRRDNFVTKKILSSAVRISKGSKEKLKLGNLNVHRDWGYAPDYVKGMWQTLQHSQPDDFIFCSETCHSLKDFLSEVFNQLGLNHEEHVEISEDYFRKNDISKNYGDSSKAKENLGWTYKKSFQDLIETLIKEEVEFQQGLSNVK